MGGSGCPLGRRQRGWNTTRGCGDPWGKPRTLGPAGCRPQGCPYQPHPPRSRLSPEDGERKCKCEKRRFSNKDSLSFKTPR